MNFAHLLRTRAFLVVVTSCREDYESLDPFGDSQVDERLDLGKGVVIRGSEEVDVVDVLVQDKRCVEGGWVIPVELD